jgi:Thoeris protein ThsB, TIR-like domain
MTFPFDLSTLIIPKRRAFVSYQHSNDQGYYNAFARHFSDTFEVIQDTSVERLIDSDDCEYVMRYIRENYISGSSCTVVLCGPGTRWRKYVDWEIKATLDREHGVVAVRLPNAPMDAYGRWHKPDRLQENLDSGYALWTTWEQLWQTPALLLTYIESANQRRKDLIANGRDLRLRNGA